MTRAQEQKMMREIKGLIAKNEELDARQQEEIEGLKAEISILKDELSVLKGEVQMLAPETKEPETKLAPKPKTKKSAKKE